jgi:hypothetical protein
MIGTISFHMFIIVRLFAESGDGSGLSLRMKGRSDSFG